MQLVIRKRVLYSALSCLIFAIIVSSISWDSLRGSPYVDRDNYSYYIDYAVNKVYQKDFLTLQSHITGEWLWHKMIDFSVVSLGLNSTEIMIFITFLITLLAALFLASRFHFLSLIFLINPIFINFIYSQLRLAFAMSILFISLYLFNKKNKLYIPLLLTTPFIHTSAIIFIFIFYSSLIIQKKISSNRVKSLISVAVGIIAGIVSGPLMSTILSALDDRRSEYGDLNSSFAYLSFWLVLLLYFLVKGFFEKNNKPFDFYLSIAILTLVAVHSIFSGYPTRFLAACFPFLLAAILSNKAKENIFVILFYIAYTVILWVYWLNYS